MSTTPRALRLTAIEPTEAQIQASIMQYLRHDRRVAWFERFNSGCAKVEATDANGRRKDRFIRFAFRGCSDLLGQLIDGRFLAIEVKTRLGTTTDDQRAFLARVRDARGVAILARSVDDVRAALDTALNNQQETTRNEHTSRTSIQPARQAT